MWMQQLFARKSLEKLHAEMQGENRLRRVLGPDLADLAGRRRHHRRRHLRNHRRDGR